MTRGLLKTALLITATVLATHAITNRVGEMIDWSKRIERDGCYETDESRIGRSDETEWLWVCERGPQLEFWR